jgi:small GTP-binding protein
MSGNEYFFKVIMLGSSGAGKTSLVQRYCHNTYAGGGHKPTLGFDFSAKKLESSGKKIAIQVWDTAGQEEYKAVAKMYYKDVHGVVLVYDTTDKTSFEKVKFWLDDLEMNGHKMEQRVIVGSKMDLITKREVTMYEGKKFATERKLEWAECSAKTGEGVIELFDTLVNMIVKEYEQNDEFKRLFARSTLISPNPSKPGGDSLQPEQPYKLHPPQRRTKKKGCC